jgi:hypothetical protein
VDISGILEKHKLWLERKIPGERANLRCANLSCANLSGANLSGADLIGANLRDTDLSGADLSSAELINADLHGADLHGAYLYGANLRGANLSRTCLDQNNKANGNVDGFEHEGDHVIGYRTARSIYCGETIYEPGKEYIAPVFSTAETECHPGLYLWPTPDDAISWSGKHNSDRHEIVGVRALASDVHKAGNKWRCRKFKVIG